MYVIREAQEHHRNVDLHLYGKACLSVHLSIFKFEKIVRKDASISWPNLLDASLQIYEGLSVRLSVGRSVTLWSISRKINIFVQISYSWDILGSLYASLYLYKTIYWSIGLSIHQSVSHASVNIKKIHVYSEQSCHHAIIPFVSLA